MDQQLVGDVTKRRLFSMGIDTVMGGFFGAVTGSVLPETLSSTSRTVAAAAAYLAYFFVAEGAFATTLGKRLFGLGVYRLDGLRAGWGGSAIRTAFRILEVNPILLGALPGGIAMALSKRRQRLGDRVAGTVVMRRPDGL